MGDESEESEESDFEEAGVAKAKKEDSHGDPEECPRQQDGDSPRDEGFPKAREKDGVDRQGQERHERRRLPDIHPQNEERHGDEGGPEAG